MEPQMQQSDHDLLVTLVAKVDAFIAGQMTSQNDHEARIRVLEQSKTTFDGGAVARREMSGTVKWVIATLIAVLSLSLAAIGILLAKQ